MSKIDFNFIVERFSDIQILRYRTPGFENLDLKQKKLIYYLSEAGLWGRDIIYDQFFKHNLKLRALFESILKGYKGDTSTAEFKEFEVFVKKFWFSNGLHHHYGMDKFIPNFSQAYFMELVNSIDKNKLPVSSKEITDDIIPVLFNPEMEAKRVNQEVGQDLVLTSACNFYENVTQKEVEGFYAKQMDKNNPQPISYGLNSKVVKRGGEIIEEVYKVDGLYSKSIEKIVENLSKAKEFACTEIQKQAIGKLIEYYQTGDLKTFDEFSILWLKDENPEIDFINGFIEVYGDPLGYKGTYESSVMIKDKELSEKLSKLAKHATWFEQNSPIMDAHRRETTTGIQYNVMSGVALAGDCSPYTYLGVNLPNSEWLRESYGSKSASMSGIEEAYHNASRTNGVMEEFYLPQQQELLKTHGLHSDRLHTGLHEVIGHASGKLCPGVATPKETLKNYANTIEEARADLFALYFIADPYMQEIGLATSIDMAHTEYNKYIVNGMALQLARINPGAHVEESHMRNRQLIAKWAFEKGQPQNVISIEKVDGKTFFKINDYDKLRELFGQLLREVQRIKSEGDYKAASDLIEGYGVKVNPELHAEVLERYNKLNVPPYSGFVNPVLNPVIKNGEIKDITLSYPETFSEQMFYYSEKYSTLI